jgi:hypothetical protein
MNGKERRSGRDRSEFANLPEVVQADQAALASPVGHEDDHGVLTPHGTLVDEEVRSIDVSAQPLSEITDEHMAGSGQENEDGLDELEASLRDAAEGDPASGLRRPLRF